MGPRNKDKNGKEPGKGINGLDERKRKVLWAVVQDYAATAEPVGSRTIAKKYDLDVSSATIRNEMQDLEDEGYLVQPHTSAGRVPSIKGYRFYVDWLMKPEPLTTEEKKFIDHMLLDHVTRVDEIFRNMAKVVARLTHTLSVAASAGVGRKLNYIRFLPLDGRRAILLAVTEEGDVSNVTVNIPRDVTLDEMQLLADKLNHFLHGKDISSVSEASIIDFEKNYAHDFTPYVAILNALQKVLSPSSQLYSGGASELIEQPEFKNLQKIQDILGVLEQRDALVNMLLSATDQPIVVQIGTENNEKSLSDLSIVRAQFKVNSQVIGSVAVLGPTRMKYSKVIGMMRFMQKRLDDLLKKKE